MPDITDKRQQILEAATKVFARLGLEKGRIEDIAEEAGVGKGTVYEYFRSKEELFEAIALGAVGEMMQMLDGLADTDMPAAGKLERFIDEGVEMMATAGDAIILMMEIWAQGARGHWHGNGQSHLVDMYRQMHAKVKSILQAGIDAGEFRAMNLDGVATIYVAFIDGLMWQYILFPDKSRFEQVKEEAIRSFLRGIAK